MDEFNNIAITYDQHEGNFVKTPSVTRDGSWVGEKIIGLSMTFTSSTQNIIEKYGNTKAQEKAEFIIRLKQITAVQSEKNDYALLELLDDYGYRDIPEHLKHYLEIDNEPLRFW